MESNEAKKYLSEQGYGSGTNYTTSTVASLMESFAYQKTTSQQQTIERLRGLVEKYMSYCSPAVRDTEVRLNKEAKELLNTTETSKAKGE